MKSEGCNNYAVCVVLFRFVSFGVVIADRDKHTYVMHSQRVIDSALTSECGIKVHATNLAHYGQIKGIR